MGCKTGYFFCWLCVVIRSWVQFTVLLKDLLFPRKNNPASQSGAPQGQVVLEVAHLVSSVWSREKEETGLIPESLNLSASQREIVMSGICSYLLPGQEALQRVDPSALSSVPAFEKYVSPEVLKVGLVSRSDCAPFSDFNFERNKCHISSLYFGFCFFPQACREKHVAVEGFMAYSVVCEGTTECSNTLEDQDDTELLPQALVYKPCRQLIYGLLLLHGHEGRTLNLLDRSQTYSTL